MGSRRPAADGGIIKRKKRLSVMDGEPILWFNQMYPRTSDTLSVKNSRIA